MFYVHLRYRRAGWHMGQIWQCGHNHRTWEGAAKCGAGQVRKLTLVPRTPNPLNLLVELTMEVHDTLYHKPPTP